MKGWVGVVKQIKNKGKKDRHLLVRFGNNHCLNISNIRQYDMQIEHEAVSGGKSEAVGVWRAIDQLIGYLQAKNPKEDAPATLRQLLADFQNQHISKKDILDSIGDTMQSNFRILAHYFHADKATVGKGLDNLIPDAVLRPFLTPTSGIAIPEGKDYAVLEHNGIVEFILRCNLRDFFRGDENEKEYIADKYEPVFDEDYEYYAHFALLPTADGKIKAMTSWGGFYDNYALKSQEEKEKFLADLEAKKYTHLHQVLAGGNPDLSPVAFEKVDGIGGFSITTDVDAMENKEELARKTNEFFQLHPALLGSLTAAAVEVWQGARLLVWRQLLQRYVLLHKVPVADLPSVISSDQEFADCFGQTEDPKGNIQNASLVLKKREASIREFLEKGQLPQAVFRLLSTTLVLSSHFAKDDLYNYIGESFNPDQTCTALFDSIFQELKKNERKRGDSEEKEKQVRLYHAAVCLHKGMVELTQQDSWTYFKFPTFLKQTQAMEKKVRELKKNMKQFKLQ